MAGISILFRRQKQLTKFYDEEEEEDDDDKADYKVMNEQQLGSSENEYVVLEEM